MPDNFAKALPSQSVDAVTGFPVPDKSKYGAKEVITRAGSVDAYGDYPEDRYLSSSATNASALDDAAFNTLTDLQPYQAVIFDTIVGEVTVQLSIDGVAFPTVTINHLFVDLGAFGVSAADSYKGYKLVNTTTGGVGPFLMFLPSVGARFLNDATNTAITSATVADPTVISSTGHGIPNGGTISITGDTTAIPSINGTHVATVLTADTFTIPVAVTTAGSDGVITPASSMTYALVGKVAI